MAPPVTKKIWKYQSYHQTTRRFEDDKDVNDVINMELPKYNNALEIIQRTKASAEDSQKMQYTIGLMMHSKLDVVLFCNAYELEEITYEMKKLKKAVQKGKVQKYCIDLHRYLDDYNEEYEKLKREVMLIFSKKLFIKCLSSTDDALDPNRPLNSLESLSKA